MKIENVSYNNKKQGFEVTIQGRILSFPYVKALPFIETRVTVSRVWIDTEIASEGFSFLHGLNQEETVHIEQVLEYNKDPGYLRDLLVYKLTIEAQQRLTKSRLGRREIIRRLGTSPAQLYRLLDQTNKKKSIDKLVELLAVLGCIVDMNVLPYSSGKRNFESSSLQDVVTTDH
jgi:predicted XRE-type DNA-binding protein